MKPAGYVAVHRSLLDHPLINQPPDAWFKVFMVILLTANWKSGVWWNHGNEIEIQPGQLVTSVEKLSKLAHVSVKQVRGCLNYLLRANTAAIETTSRYTLLTRTNWATYQTSQTSNGKPTGKPEGKRGAKSRQSGGKVRATIEEGNHHQGNKREEKEEMKRARAFPDGQESAVKQHKGQPLSESASRDDDDENIAYATPTDELKALFRKHSARLTVNLLDHVRSKLGGDITQAFVDELKTHNGNFTNYPGFVRKLAGERSRIVTAPVTAEEAYKCQDCASTVSGVGLLVKPGEAIEACRCATKEYAAKMTENGTIGPWPAKPNPELTAKRR